MKIEFSKNINVLDDQIFSNYLKIGKADKVLKTHELLEYKFKRDKDNRKIVYVEELEPEVILIIKQNFQNFGMNTYSGGCSKISLEAEIITGELSEYTGGGVDFWEAKTEEIILKNESFRSLRELKSRLGNKVFEVVIDELDSDPYKRKEFKSRKIKWVIEISAKELMGFFKE